jgi:subtilisin family serine protease
VNGKTLTADATLTLELGKPMQISTHGSRAHAEFPGTLASAIVVVPSKLSRLGQQTFSASEISYLPDAVGAYRIYGVVQDGRDVCATEAANLIITTNPAFAPPGSEPKVNTQFMRHLRELDAQNVWALSEGQGQFIAIVDSGVNYNHPLLAPNMEINLGETANGEDEDGNGLKDDILGYDFVNSDPFPFDDDGHGSHVAGLASGRQFGLARKAHILAIKSMTAMGGDAASVAAGIHYAVDRGARILNLSLGMNDPHPLLIEAVAYAEDHGALLIVAAGNGDFHSGLGFDIDQIPLYPACLPNENILAVAASDHINALAPYSNFGKQNVDIVAPGGVGEIALVSTATLNPSGDLYSTMSGTSMAAPLVAAAAADLLAKAPTLKPHEVVQKIMDTGRLDAVLNKVTRSGRRLDARALLSNVSF